MKIPTLRDLSVQNKRVLMRVDFNVPQNKDGTISDDSRIQGALSSIKYVLAHGGSLVLMSHLGRPKGKVETQFSLLPISQHLAQLLQQEVLFAPDCVGSATEKMAAKLNPGQIILLENLRFHPGEEEPESEPNFVQSLAKLGDLYVNEAFGTAHRAHASTALIAKYFPHKGAIGFLMEKEIAALSPLIHHPERPFHVIIGGAKISSKAGVIRNLLKSVDALFLGGGMAFTFFKAQGLEIGDSIFESDQLHSAKELLASAKEKIHLPIDLVIADRFAENGNKKIISAKEGIPAGWQGMDIGPETVRRWSDLLRKAATVFWNGPLGVFEMPSFAAGTRGIAEALARLSGNVTIGGGDSVAAIEQMGLANRFSHLSTGGGASLEYLEFGHLPGIDAIIANN